MCDDEFQSNDESNLNNSDTNQIWQKVSDVLSGNMVELNSIPKFSGQLVRLSRA